MCCLIYYVVKKASAGSWFNDIGFGEGTVTLIFPRYLGSTCKIGVRLPKDNTSQGLPAYRGYISVSDCSL